MIWLICFVIVNLIVAIAGSFFLWVIGENKKIKWKEETKKSVNEVLKQIIIACVTFVLIGSVTTILQYENNQNKKNNEPLILGEQPLFENKGNESRLKLKVKQGTVVKGLIVLFNDNKVSYSSIRFNGNSDLVSNNFKIISKNVIVKPQKDLQTQIIKGNPVIIDTPQIIINQRKLVQLGVILKDTKGNISSYYYLVRPSASVKKGYTWGLSVYDGNDTYCYSQECNNYSKAKVLINCPIIGTNSEEYDLSNIEYQIENNKKQITNYKFHLVKPKDRTIKASNFKAHKGEKTLQHDAEPGKNATITSDPIITLHYNIPNEKEISKNIKIMDEIIKDY